MSDCGDGELPRVLQPGSMFGGPDEIHPGLYLGGFLALDACRRLGIQYVLSLVDASSQDQIKEILGELLDGSKGGPPLTICHIDVEDKPTANLLVHLDKSVDFIANALANGEMILVHCMAGVSRSATTVAAYLVKHEGLSPTDALSLVKEKRACANPNTGFIKQLSAWHDMGCKVDKQHHLYSELFGKSCPTKAASVGNFLGHTEISGLDSTGVKRETDILYKDPSKQPAKNPLSSSDIGLVGISADEDRKKTCCVIS